MTARVAVCGLLLHPVSVHLGVPDTKLLSLAEMPYPPHLVWGGADAHPGLGSAFPVAPFRRLHRLSCCHGVEPSIRPRCAPWRPACCHAAESHPLTPRMACMAGPHPESWVTQPSVGPPGPPAAATLNNRDDRSCHLGVSPQGQGRRADLFLEGTFLPPWSVPAVTQHFSTRADGDPYLRTFGQAWRCVAVMASVGAGPAGGQGRCQILHSVHSM